jgi:hypothetical protein
VVWDAIALHTTPEILGYKRPEVRRVTLGVDRDVLGFRTDELSPERRNEVGPIYPRTGFKAGIVDALFEGGREKPETEEGSDGPARLCH